MILLKCLGIVQQANDRKINIFCWEDKRKTNVAKPKINLNWLSTQNIWGKYKAGRATIQREKIIC